MFYSYLNVSMQLQKYGSGFKSYIILIGLFQVSRNCKIGVKTHLDFNSAVILLKKVKPPFPSYIG